MNLSTGIRVGDGSPTMRAITTGTVTSVGEIQNTTAQGAVHVITVEFRSDAKIFLYTTAVANIIYLGGLQHAT